MMYDERCKKKAVSSHFPAIDFDAVADLYDSYVRVDFDIPFWLQESKVSPGRVLELGCGTGRVSIPLLKAGIQLDCVDYSSGMLAQFKNKLRETGLACPVHCQDMADLDLPDRYDLIFIPFHSFSEVVDSQRQRLTLERIRLHLSEHGVFICTLQNPFVRTASMDGTLRPIGEFSLLDRGTLVVSTCLTFNPETRIASGNQVYEQYSADKNLIDRRVLNVRFRLFPKNEFESLASGCGYTVQELYGDYQRQPFDEQTSPYMIWKLRSASVDELPS